MNHKAVSDRPRRRTVACVLVGVSLVACVAANVACADESDKAQLLTWKQLPDLPDPHGVAGPFTGIHNDALIVAGGANFPAGVPWHLTKNGGKSLKNYHDAIYVLTKHPLKDSTRADSATVVSTYDYCWITTKHRLAKPLAYGVSIPTANGLVCVGGEWQEHIRSEDTGEIESTLRRSDDVFVLRWNPKSEDIEISRQWPISGNDSGRALPKFPVAITSACGAMVGNAIYIAGGDTGEGGCRRSWRLDLTGTDSGSQWEWEELPSWDGPPRTHAIAVEQAGSLFLFSGRSRLAGQGIKVFTDAYRFDPAVYEHERSRATPNANGQTLLPSYANGWMRIADIAPDGQQPRCVMTGTGIGSGFDYVLIFGGARGDVLRRREHELPMQIEAARTAGSIPLANELTKQANALYDDHSGFSRDILAYHITTDTWTTRGQMPVTSPVTTTAVSWGDSIVIPSGEKSPGVRTRDIWLASPQNMDRSFGVVNWTVLASYLGVLVAVGIYCSSREKNSDDFFVASGRMPWWAAGLSIFATMLSAITYLSIPARAYGTNWSWMILNLGIPVVSIIVVFLYLSSFRRLRVASAYQFLEQRFHVSLRLFGSISFILFQLGRMGIVILLPALALSAVTGIDVNICIVAMGLLSTFYTVLGGIEAVIWTDVVQVVVLVGGAIAALVIIATNTNGGILAIIDTASAHGKLDMINSFHFHDLSWAKDGILVMMIAAFFTNLLPYTSDQAVIQRYLTVANESEARRAIWTNAIVVIPATILFFFVGTALWSFYEAHPAALVPLQKPDQIFPWFISHEMPAGLAGIVIAGVFAAAMSSLDSSMHSIATVGTVDFYERFGRKKTQEESLRVARRLTIVLGIVGTASALILVHMEIKYLWDLFLLIIGLFLGTLGGLFTLGIFSTRAKTIHAWLGVTAGIAVLTYCQFATDLNGLLNGAIAVVTCFTVGVATSWIFCSTSLEIEIAHNRKIRN